MSYQPTIPTGRVGLNQDYLNVMTNFSQLNTQFSVDHVPLTSTSGSPPNGYHTDIHLVSFSTVASNPTKNYPPTAPSTVANFGQLFSAQVNDGNNTDTALFFKCGPPSGSGRLLQLTSNFTPGVDATGSSFTNGATFLPGGFILNWGYESNSSTGNINVSLKKSFDNNFFGAQATYRSGGIGLNYATLTCTNSPSGGTVTDLKFNDNIGKSFYWWAIGN